MPGPARPLQQRTTRTVAVLETRVPDVARFLLRGTVPLPPGIFPRVDGLVPFTILDYDGTPLVTQAEVVSRYPVDGDGADVVELLARVTRDPALAVGARARYEVALWHATPAPLSDLGPVPEEVNDLLLDPSSIRIQAFDCFGQLYECRPSLADVNAILHRGPVFAEARVYQDMLPSPAVDGRTLPHMFGVHSYISWARASLNVGLDLRFHNAHDGHDASTRRDDPLDTLYFHRIEISVPESWTVLQDFVDPLFGKERLAGGRRIVELVGPEPSGGLHVIRWQGQFHRRLMLVPARPASLRAGRAQLDGAGRAFCTRGFTPRGVEYWSWWNEGTSRYFPQRHQLPRLDHVGPAVLEAELDGDLAFVATHLTDGTGTGNYPLSAARLGWGHPYGVAYGGMTSGLEISCYDGVVAASVASPAGFQLYSALHRMQTDRQPNALFQENGAPSTVEEWLIENGADDYVPFEHFVVPLISGSRPDPFGVHNAPRFQVDYVRQNNLRPAYEGAHFSYDPHDYQHFIRYTRSAKVLAWLANDSLAKDDLRMQAENFHLSFHAYANNAFGVPQSSGLLNSIRAVQAVPHKGFFFGRGEAWGMDCAVSVYALAEPSWRARKLPWLQQQTRVLLEGQASCSGFIQAVVSSKAVDGKYYGRQLIEQSITENTLAGLHESVFREAHQGYSFMVRDVLVGSLRAFIGEMSWFPGEFGPWRYTGVGPLNRTLPVWCTRAEMPDDAWTAGDIDTFQDWSSFAYGYELTHDTVFLERARLQAGASSFTDLLDRLKLAGTNNIENKAALLALVQRLQGEL